VRRIALLVILLALSSEAAAHGSIAGLGHFSGGLLHPLVEPTHLIAIVALGLVIGQRGLARMEPVLICFAVGSTLGLAGAGLGWTVDAQTPLLALAALLGIAVATSARLPSWFYGIAAALLGVGIGLGSRPESASELSLLSTLAGTGLGASLWPLAVVAVVQPLRRPWLLILVRVLGSWASASAILVLALWVSGRHAPAPVPTAAILQLDTRR
jgi:urease accessory protein